MEKHYFTPKSFNKNDDDYDYCAVCGKNFRDTEQHISEPQIKISDNTKD